jgi:hypothetical protein
MPLVSHQNQIKVFFIILWFISQRFSMVYESSQVIRLQSIEDCEKVVLIWQPGFICRRWEILGHYRIQNKLRIQAFDRELVIAGEVDGPYIFHFKQFFSSSRTDFRKSLFISLIGGINSYTITKIYFMR